MNDTSAPPQWHRFADAVAVPRDYSSLWQWSVDHPARFWRAVWDYFGIQSDTAPADGDEGVLTEPTMPDARWFPGVTVNYVEAVLRHCGRAGPAIIGIDESGTRTQIDWSELPGRIGAVAAELRRLGVGPGDHVGAYLPDVADAVVAFLATAALGAVWSGCGQDYAPQGAATRLGQLEPKVVFSCDGYQFNGRWIDKRSDTVELIGLLPGEPHLLLIDGERYRELIADPQVIDVTRVAFDHPLWVLFTSGTTGAPKGIVHGHGGVVLEHLKAAALHADLSAEDVFFWQTALSWMMWNFRTAGLLLSLIHI